jgi:hypothetical protein
MKRKPDIAHIMLLIGQLELSEIEQLIQILAHYVESRK